MVRLSYSALTASAALLASASAQNVDCVVNGNVVATVDLATGSCPFTIPSDLTVQFDFTSVDDYLVDFYYALAQDVRYFNDIVNAGRIISIPAASLYNAPAAPLFHVHAEKQSPGNSTAAIRKRLFKDQTGIYKRDAASDFAESLKSLDGTQLPAGNDVSFAVVDSANTTSSASDSTATATNTETTIITITSCSDNKCAETTVPATQGVTTVTVDDEVTSYTTWCPVTATETVKKTTIVTITSCSDNKCNETPVPATEGPVTTTVNGKETVYTTWCPVTAEETTVVSTGPGGKASTYTTTVTPGTAPAPAPASTVVTTTGANGAATTYTTVKTVEAESVYPTVTPSKSAAPGVTVPGASTVKTSAAPATAAPAVTTASTGAAVANGVSAVVALALIPLALL